MGFLDFATALTRLSERPNATKTQRYTNAQLTRLPRHVRVLLSDPHLNRNLFNCWNTGLWVANYGDSYLCEGKRSAGAN
jgi:hypothetical protein